LFGGYHQSRFMRVKAPATDARARSPLSRKAFVALTALLPLQYARAIAQPMPSIGYVANANDAPDRLAAFRRGLGELGYVEGRNISIAFYYAKATADYGSLIRDLLNHGVALIVVGNAQAAVAAHAATTSVPIVMAAVNDPVGLGLVQSLAHPVTNVTGTTMYAPGLIAERVLTLRRILPALDRAAMLVNGANANNAAQYDLFVAAAKANGVDPMLLDVRTPADFTPAIARARAGGANGLFNAVDNVINSQRVAMAASAAALRLAAIYSDREYVLAGGLMAIGPGHLEGFYGAAKYVVAILRGAAPADLAVDSTKNVDFTVSRSALARLGLLLPRDVEARVTEWVS
jgi:putative ABC transport system substrate-binding protein